MVHIQKTTRRCRCLTSAAGRCPSKGLVLATRPATSQCALLTVQYEEALSCSLSHHALLLFGGCGQHPQINVTSGIDNGSVVFDITARDMNGILGFAVLDGTNTLWQLSTSYEKGARIVYGVLPDCGNMVARQLFPSSGSAPAPIVDKVVTVAVDYQYDADGSPCVGHFSKSMRIPNTSQAVPLDKVH